MTKSPSAKTYSVSKYIPGTCHYILTWYLTRVLCMSVRIYLSTFKYWYGPTLATVPINRKHRPDARPSQQAEGVQKNPDKLKTYHLNTYVLQQANVRRGIGDVHISRG